MVPFQQGIEMKIMTAMYTLRRGGAYGRFLMMIEAFLERKCEVHCLSLTPIQIDHSFYHNHIIHFPFKKVDGLIAKLAVLSIFPPWAIWVGWRNKIDIIIAFGSLYAFIQGLAKWWLKKCMVTLIRGKSAFGLGIQNSSKWTLYLNNFIEDVGIHFSDRIITNNVAARAEILKNLGRRRNIDVQVLYNNIPPMNIPKPEDISRMRDRYGIPKNAKVLVTAGILNRGKNIETLIECLPRIQMKNIYVLIAGDGSTEADLRYKESLLVLAKKLEVDERVIFTGWLEKEDLWKIYAASDLFVLSSLSEGMPNAMLEALGAGLLCMGSNIPGIRDILEYDELTFNPHDENALFAKIYQLFTDQQFLHKIKKICQKRKDSFDFDWKEKVFEMITETPTSLIK
jgi:glycosyltransferase involved in cell wall biosynthesis